MQQADIHSFLMSFFKENDCRVTSVRPGILNVNLTEEMDKTFMNRPFYWHYIEKMGAKGEPASLTFRTDYQETEGKTKDEFIHFGSPRLHQIFSYTVNKGRFGQFYENVSTSYNAVPLKPWLCLNGKMIYQCHQKKETPFSIGLSLITGEMLNEFHSFIRDWPVTSAIPDYTFTLTPLIKVESGAGRIQDYLIDSLESQEHHWADKANMNMQEELNLLAAFYKDHFPKPESYKNERDAIVQQYEPVIQIDITNGGIFYLNNHPLTDVYENKRR